MTSTPRRNSLHTLVIIGLLLYIPLLLKTFQVFEPHPSSSSFTNVDQFQEHRRDLETSSRSSALIQSLQNRVQYLETKVNHFLAYTTDPFLRLRCTAKCQKRINIKDVACPGGVHKGCELDNIEICMDSFGGGDDQNQKKPSCVVYDYGIRESPQFGLYFADKLNCQVAAFDPSPITKKYFSDHPEVINNTPNYRLYEYGAGGKDEDLVLREYNWGQIALYQYPAQIIDPTRCDETGHCKYHFFKQQGTVKVPVQTLATTLKELGHERITLLKLDVEGSEYRFLEQMIDDGSCLKVDQLTLEWHHYDFDLRYGTTSNPEINVLVALLKERCGLEQYWVHGSTGWPSNEKMYSDMGLTLYYTMSSFMRTVAPENVVPVEKS